MQAYLRALEKNPIAVKAVTSAVLWGLGDSLAQYVERSGDASSGTSKASNAPKQQDWARTGRLAFFGGAIFAPMTHAWYNQLQRWFPEPTFAAALKKMALDQSLYAPFILSVLFGSTSLMEGKTTQQAIDKVKSTIVPTLQVNWAIWPAVQIINMRYVPVQHRILVVNVLNIPWTTYLALQAAKPAPSSSTTSSTASSPGAASKSAVAKP